MTDSDNARAAKEARETVSRLSASTRRQQLWAGLNRYLATEGEHARKVAREEADEKDGPPA